ncbi:hypothetical protein PUNSTDRAFT_127507 [Punctularia strigosozonata HHB-11173 SS5]|uniref:uncharacterized protein n=1 Tax=Punctularia strigosozonata (strain HHB-11173) TaxID=741275 RepID=UPI0004417108|nr:uncharacterized protein PUNSTDRAFT_127507 [Punctularia strigosozonata HHB-11173 SS5]EIN06049.1 hypothetical protein PUNSTDRAFT_127507 [Punctularia strigosozonata HHB-11173 SS5]
MSLRPPKRPPGDSPPAASRKKKAKKVKFEHIGGPGRAAPTPVAKPDVFSSQAGPSTRCSASTSADAIYIHTAPDTNARASSVESLASDGPANDEQHETWDREVDAELANYAHFGLRKGTPLEGLSQLMVLQAIVKAGGTRHFADGETSKFLAERPDVAALLSKSWLEDKGYRAVRQHEAIRFNAPPVVSVANTPGLKSELRQYRDASIKVTEISWKEDYVGDAHIALRKHIAKYWGKEGVYAPYCSIVQSSGCGKSRCADQFAKTHFCIPMNLRIPTASGFPASDDVLYTFFEGMKPLSAHRMFIHNSAFLVALFQACTRTLREEPRGEHASWFYDKMTEGQSMTSHNAFRRNFYERVVGVARKLVGDYDRLAMVSGASASKDRARSPIAQFGVTVIEAAKQLCAELANDDEPPTSPTKPQKVTKPGSKAGASKKQRLPRVILIFDEAHTLTENAKSAAVPRPSLSNSTGRAPNTTPSTFQSNVISKGKGKGPALAAPPAPSQMQPGDEEAELRRDAEAFGYDATNVSPFSQLRRVLRSLRHQPIFALFLSTTGKITQFTSPKESDPSKRVMEGGLRLIPPFCAIGFDQLASPWPEPLTLAAVSDIGYQARLGRPMFAARYIAAQAKGVSEYERRIIQDDLVRFAAEKILRADIDRIDNIRWEQQLACLAWRVPIQFMSSTPTAQEMDQVANHMRVCISIDETFRRMFTLNPSEPVLSEGARKIMSFTGFKPHVALSNVLHGFSVHQGDRGELLGLLLLILARDQAVVDHAEMVPRPVFGVVPFLQQLFRIPENSKKRLDNLLKALPSVYRVEEDKKRPLGEAFKDVLLHFNHFIKRESQNRLTPDMLECFIARNAAFMGATGQAGVDAGLVTVKGTKDTTIKPSNMGLVLFQFKLDTHYTATVQEEIFESMDPFALGFMKKDQQIEVPIIRIVFAFASKVDSIQCVKTQKEGSVTCYDIWVSGLSAKVFSPIEPADEESWKSLRQVSYGWQKKYHHDDSDTSTLMKNMNPLGDNGMAFRSFRYKGAKRK